MIKQSRNCNADVMLSTDMLWKTYVLIIAQCMFDLYNSNLPTILLSSTPYPCVERVIVCFTEMNNHSTE